LSSYLHFSACVFHVFVRKRKPRKDFRHSWYLNKHGCEQKTAISMHGTLS